jgi:spore coat polysaccharide biosynthesis protein SpsF
LLESKKNIFVIIQARRSSTRFPGKILLPLSGKPLLIRMAERVAASGYGKNIIVATTTGKDDDVIENLCKDNNINFYRGETDDLLDRHYKAGLEFGADIVVKIPSDCPLISPSVIDKVIGFYIGNESNYDFVSNLHPATYPDGNDIEVIPMEILETAWKEAKLPLEREHTTPFIWERPDRFRIGNVEWETGLDFSMSHRLTIDYEEDYEFIKRIYDELYEVDPFFELEEILKLLEAKPEIKTINEKYAGVNWYRNHIKDLKTIDESKTKIINGH